jgi:hypothetical protein
MAWLGIHHLYRRKTKHRRTTRGDSRLSLHRWERSLTGLFRPARVLRRPVHHSRLNMYWRTNLVRAVFVARAMILCQISAKDALRSIKRGPVSQLLLLVEVPWVLVARHHRRMYRCPLHHQSISSIHQAHRHLGSRIRLGARGCRIQWWQVVQGCKTLRPAVRLVLSARHHRPPCSLHRIRKLTSSQLQDCRFSPHRILPSTRLCL